MISTMVTELSPLNKQYTMEKSKIVKKMGTATLLIEREMNIMASGKMRRNTEKASSKTQGLE
jgi:hypothetical protein